MQPGTCSCSTAPGNVKRNTAIFIANDKVLFTLSFAAPDLRRPKAAYFLGKSVRIRRRLYSERQVFSDVHYKNIRSFTDTALCHIMNVILIRVLDGYGKIRG